MAPSQPLDFFEAWGTPADAAAEVAGFLNRFGSPLVVPERVSHLERAPVVTRDLTPDLPGG